MGKQTIVDHRGPPSQPGERLEISWGKPRPGSRLRDSRRLLVAPTEEHFLCRWPPRLFGEQRPEAVRDYSGRALTPTPIQTTAIVPALATDTARSIGGHRATLGVWSHPTLNAGPAAARLLPVHDYRHRLWAVRRSRRPNLDPARIVTTRQTCAVNPDLHGGPVLTQLPGDLHEDSSWAVSRSLGRDQDVARIGAGGQSRAVNPHRHGGRCGS